MAKTSDTPVTDPVEEGDAFLLFLSRYKTVILAAILIVSGVYLYRVVTAESSSKAKAAAAAEFAAAGDNIAMLQSLIEEFPSEGITPLARMKLAQAYYRASNYQMADTTYSDFLSAHPGHDLAPAAVLGKAHCTEGRGDYEGAIREFDAWLKDPKLSSHSYLRPQAELGKARCTALTGKLREARNLYEEFVAGSDEGSHWAITAEQAIEDLDVKLEKLEPAEEADEDQPADEEAGNDDPEPAGDAE